VRRLADARAGHQVVGRVGGGHEIVALTATVAGARLHACIAARHHGQREVAHRALAGRVGQVARLAGVEFGGVQGGIDEDGLIPGHGGIQSLVDTAFNVLESSQGEIGVCVVCVKGGRGGWGGGGGE